MKYSIFIWIYQDDMWMFYCYADSEQDVQDILDELEEQGFCRENDIKVKY